MLAIFWVNYSACQPDLFWQKTKKETYRDKEKGGETENVYQKGKGIYIKPATNESVVNTSWQPHTQNSLCHSLCSIGLHVNNSVENQVLNAIHKFFWCFMEERGSLPSVFVIFFSFPKPHLNILLSFPSWLLKDQLLSPLLDCAWETQNTFENCSFL